MAESVDGLRYIMSFDADTKAFEAAIDRMRKGIESLQKTGATLMSGGGSSGSRGGGSGGGGKNAVTDAEKTQQYLNDRLRTMRRQAMREESRDADAARARKQKDDDRQREQEYKSVNQRNKDLDSINRRMAENRSRQAWSDAGRGNAGRYGMMGGGTSRAYQGRGGGAGPMSSAETGGGGGGDASGGFFGKASALVVGMELGKAQKFAEGVAEAAWNSVAAFGQLYSKTTEEAALFQDIESGLRFTFGDSKYEHIFEKVKEEAAKTSFTLAEVAKLTQVLGMQKINPFENANGEALKFMGRTGQTVTALEVLQDAASASGKNMLSVQKGVLNFMSGNSTSLAAHLELPQTLTKAWMNETKKMKTEQDKFQFLMTKLGERFGGASAGKKLNWNFLTAQIPDLLQQIYAAMGSGAIKAMTPGLKDFYDGLERVVKDPKALGALAETFTVIGKVLGAGMSGASKIIDFTRSIIDAEPHLPLFVAGIVGMGVAAVGTTASITAMALSVAVLAAGVAAVGVEIAAVALIPTLIAGAAAATAFGLGATLMLGAFASSRNKVSGFVETLQDARVMVVALQEAFASWGDSTYEISEESYNALEKRGITGYFEQVVDWANRAEKFVRGFGKGLADGVGPELKKVGDTFDEITDTVTGLMSALGLMGPATEDSAGKAASAGESMGQKVSYALNLILKGVNTVQEGFLYMFENAPDIIRSLSEVWFSARLTANVFQEGFAIVKALAGFMWYGLVSPVRVLYHATMEWVDALRIGMSYAQQGMDIMSGKKLSDEDKKLYEDERQGLRDSSKDHAKQAGEILAASDPGIANTMREFVKDSVQNAKDVASAYEQRDQMNKFATKMENNYAEVQDRRDKENFATARREGLAGPQPPGLLYTPPEETSSSFRPLGQRNLEGVEQLQSGETVRRNTTQNINVVLQVDQAKLGEVMMSIQENDATMSGNGLNYSVSK